MNDYSHSEYVKCIEVGDFAKIFENQLRCKCGKAVGRNKVYQVLRELGMICKDNSPSQAYMKHFRLFVKNYQQGDSMIVKKILLIRRESMQFLVEKIGGYVADNCVHNASVGRSEVSVEGVREVVDPSSPLDFDRERAFEWLQGIPDFLKNSYFAREVRAKWGFEGV